MYCAITLLLIDVRRRYANNYKHTSKLPAVRIKQLKEG